MTTANAEVTAPKMGGTALKNEPHTLSQTGLGTLILVVLVIIVLLLTGRSQGG
jgi:hypothetical protein